MTPRTTEEEIKIFGAIRSARRADKLAASQVADDGSCYVQKVAKFGEKIDREHLLAAIAPTMRTATTISLSEGIKFRYSTNLRQDSCAASRVGYFACDSKVLTKLLDVPERRWTWPKVSGNVFSAPPSSEAQQLTQVGAIANRLQLPTVTRLSKLVRDVRVMLGLVQLTAYHVNETIK